MRPAWSAKQRDFDDIARRPHKFPSFLQKFLTCSSSARNPDRPNPHSSEPSRLLLPADTKTDGEKTICYRNIELIGIIGGLTNSLSSAPQLIDNLRIPDRAYGQNASRNTIQCLGNGKWLIYGVSIGSLAITTFSSLGSAMAAVLFWQVVRCKRRECLMGLNAL